MLRCGLWESAVADWVADGVADGVADEVADLFQIEVGTVDCKNPANSSPRPVPPPEGVHERSSANATPCRLVLTEGLLGSCPYGTRNL